MGLDAIIELKEFEMRGNFRGFKAEVAVHCSCGNDYTVKEKFPLRTLSCARPTKCPSCKEKSYLQHIIRPEENIKSIRGGRYLRRDVDYAYSAKIVSPELKKSD